MNKEGRHSEEKVWETRFRHSFYANYMHDPDLHTLLFTSALDINEIIREALRDYIKQTGNKAADPEFQQKVFVGASKLMSQGHRPVGSEVMAQLGEKPTSARRSGKSAATPRRKTDSPAPSNSFSARLDSLDVPTQAVPEMVPTPPPVAAYVPVTPTFAPPAPPAPVMSVVPTVKKPAVVLDFGLEPVEGDSGEEAEEAKPTQRSKWLARHLTD